MTTSAQITISTSIRRIRLGDLGPSATEHDIRGLLLAFGPVRSYERPLNRVTKRPGDFAMVEMHDPGATRAIAALHGRVFRDQILVVTAQVSNSTKALPRRPSSATALAETPSS